MEQNNVIQRPAALNSNKQLTVGGEAKDIK